MGLCRLMIMLRSYFMVISQLEPDFALSNFCVLTLGDDATMDDVISDIVSPDILCHVVGEFDSMDQPLSSDILSGFVSCSDDVLAFSSMDLSIFEYSPVFFIDDIDACTPHSPTS